VPYSTLYPLSPFTVDSAKQRIFAPVCATMHIHTIKLCINGQSQVRGFKVQHPWVLVDNVVLGCEIESSDELWLEIEYFYKSNYGDVLDTLVDKTYQANTASKTKSILSNHYVDGHFALDNGLYKEAVTNFGTVIETLVNRKLEDNTTLDALISKDPTASSDPNIQKYMHDLRKLRNRVHPNQISKIGSIGREDAEDARFKLQDIIYLFFKVTNPHA
jgi:hypothetical protein